MTDLPSSRSNSWLSLVQRLLLMLTIFIAVISSPRILLFEVDPLANVPIEFRAVTLSLPDFVLLMLILITLIRLVGESGYAERLLRTALTLLRRGLIFWLALLLWMSVSLLWSSAIVMTRFVTIHAAAGVLLALLLADLVQHDGTQWLLWGLISSAVLQSVIGIAQSLNGNPLGLGAFGELPRFTYDTDRFFRAAGLSQHPNYLGGYLMVSVFACLFIAWQHSAQRWLCLALAVICGIGLITTLSRSAIVGTGIGLLPLLVILFRQLNAARRRLILTSLVVLMTLGLALVLVATRGDIATRFFTGREFFFADSWHEIQLSPLLGTGAGALMLSISEHGSQLVDVLPVHNVYLYIWAESGLIGMVLFIAACGVLIWHIRHNPAALIWGCALLGVCVTMLFDNYWWAIHPFQIVFFWIMGYWWGETLPQPTVAREQSQRV